MILFFSSDVFCLNCISNSNLDYEYCATLNSDTVSELALEEIKRSYFSNEKKPIKGFRKGVAPSKGTMKRLVSDEVRKNVLKKIVHDMYGKITEDIIDSSMIIEYDSEILQDVKQITLKFAVLPVIPDIEYKDMIVEDFECNVDDNHINDEIQKAKDDYFEFIESDSDVISIGDKVTVNLKSDVDNIEDKKITVSDIENDTFSTLHRSVVGLSANSECSVNILFPEDYKDEKFAGKNVEFQMFVKCVLKKRKPKENDNESYDDTLALSMGFKNDEDLREKFADAIRKRFKRHVQNIAKKTLFDRLSECFDFDVPKSLLDLHVKEVRNVLDNDNDEKMSEEEIVNLAMRRLRIACFILRFAKTRDISVEEQEVTKVMSAMDQKVLYDLFLHEFAKNPSGGNVQYSIIERIKENILENKVVGEMLKLVSRPVESISPSELLKMI